MNHFGIIAEDNSDCDTLKVLVKRLSGDSKPRFTTKGFKGGGNLMKFGDRELRQFKDKKGCNRFIICHDADGPPSKVAGKYQEMVKKVVKPASVYDNENNVCILIPVQELETWILADHNAIKKVIKKWSHKQNYNQPEQVANPKEVIEKASRISGKRPLFTHALHNTKVAEHLNLEIVKKKCPSFAVLADFIEKNQGNYPK